MGCGVSDTPETLFRRHIGEMRKYADELEPMFGPDFGVIRRIRKCADECERALGIIAKHSK